MENEFRNPLELVKIFEPEKIFEQDVDLHVRGIIFYRNEKGIAGIGGIDNIRPATREEFIDAYIKGAMLIASDDENIHKPVSMHIQKDYVTVSFFTASPGAESNGPKYIGVGKLPNLGPL